MLEQRIFKEGAGVNVRSVELPVFDRTGKLEWASLPESETNAISNVTEPMKDAVQCSTGLIVLEASKLSAVEPVISDVDVKAARIRDEISRRLVEIRLNGIHRLIDVRA
jgi:hypothetical protein